MYRVLDGYIYWERTIINIELELVFLTTVLSVFLIKKEKQNYSNSSTPLFLSE